MSSAPEFRSNRSQQRDRMVRQQIAARGIRDDRVMEAMRSVPREEFVAPEAVDFAYSDSALPIEADQTISQPYIVALMAEALSIQPGERVLEVGSGSGYAAAVLSHLSARVFAVERHNSLVESARLALDRADIENVTVRHADGTLGWEDEAPFDAILVSAGGPEVPQPLLDQLAPGGRLVIPVGEHGKVQQLKRFRKDPGSGEIHESDLGAVRFVPLMATVAPDTEEGSGEEPEVRSNPGTQATTAAPPDALDLVNRHADRFEGVDDDALDRAADRMAGHRAVLIGEASHGTSEFYTLRERLTRRLIERGEIDFVAVEADWPDAAHLDAWVRGVESKDSPLKPFQRFPRWMWANRETLEFLRWLREFNESIDDPDDRVGFFGLDLYSLNSSIEAVLAYLDDVDPETGKLARERFGCLTPWERDPQTYGRLATSGRMNDCEDEVVEILGSMLEKRLEYVRADGREYMHAVENARLVTNAERYYRAIYQGPTASWNLRDQHMMDTLQSLLGYHGPGSAGAVWAHNSHLGNASATELGTGGKFNLGQLCREEFGPDCYSVGMGTHTGTVMAAHEWDDPGEVMEVRPSLENSWERLSHDADAPAFFLPLGQDESVERAMTPERLERAIGVIYRPQTERMSHYFHASLARQFDEWLFVEETEAVSPLDSPSDQDPEQAEAPDTWPFAV